MRKAADEAREREAETRKLLEGSERIGREMEDQLADRDARLRELAVKLDAIETERDRQKQAELARLAGLGDERDEREREVEKMTDLETRVEGLVKSEAGTKSTLERLAREWETKFAAKEGENESLRERMAAAAKAAEEERQELTRQLDQLRNAGQALCETYEERIADIEVGRLEAVELAENLQSELEQVRTARAASPGSPSGRLSSSQVARTSAADVIDAESAKAEVEHLRSKLGAMEEQLEEARAAVEAEVEEAQRRKTKSSDIEQGLRSEIKSLKETVGECKASFVFCDSACSIRLWQSDSQRPSQRSPLASKSSKRRCSTRRSDWKRNAPN